MSENDPMAHVAHQVEGIVGSDELEQRRKLGDKRYDELIDIANRRDNAVIRFTDARAKIREAYAACLALAVVVALAVGVAFAVWFLA